MFATAVMNIKFIASLSWPFHFILFHFSFFWWKGEYLINRKDALALVSLLHTYE